MLQQRNKIEIIFEMKKLSSVLDRKSWTNFGFWSKISVNVRISHSTPPHTQKRLRLTTVWSRKFRVTIQTYVRAGRWWVKVSCRIKSKEFKNCYSQLVLVGLLAKIECGN